MDERDRRWSEMYRKASGEALSASAENDQLVRAYLRYVRINKISMIVVAAISLISIIFLSAWDERFFFGLGFGATLALLIMINARLTAFSRPKVVVSNSRWKKAIIESVS